MEFVSGNQLEYIETPGGNASVGLATPSRGATGISLIRQRQAPGGTNPPHSHDLEEVMHILEGTVTVTVEGQIRTLCPGDTLIVPSRALHQIVNTGDQPAEWLLIAPSGVQFFHANGEPANPPWAN